MIRHRNYYEMAATIDTLEEFTLAQDLFLLYLPLAHNYGRLVSCSARTRATRSRFSPTRYAAADALPKVQPDGSAERAAPLREGARDAIKAQFDAATGCAGACSTGR